jgi:hypothetical protein
MVYLGPITPGKGAALVDLLIARGEQPSLVEIDDGRALEITFDCWGRDHGSDWEHVYLKGDQPGPYFFVTSEIVWVTAQETNDVLYVRPAV